MNKKFIQFQKWIEEHNLRILWFLIITYIIFFSIFSIYKYLTFNYVGLDLSIFNQVFYNTSQGNFFELTIHPHSYLGDHFALIIFLLSPLYLILISPATLLIIQAVSLAVSAYFLYLIARKKLSKNLSLFISFLYLINVFVHNINSYEFHILVLAIPLLLITFYFYQQGKFSLFLLFSALSTIIREDVSLVILMFGILALIERKSLKWILWPIIMSAAWFAFAMKMTGIFSGYGQYKFIKYYGWLGEDVRSIILTLINQPIKVLKHLFSSQNISFLTGLFLPFGFLPFLKAKYILPALLIIIQILLLTLAGALALETHYTTLIVPFLFISLIYVLYQIFYKENKNRFLNILKRERGIFLTILVLINIYSTLVIGPSLFYILDLAEYPKIKEEVKLRNDFVEQIPKDSAVATGYHFLPKLSSKEKIYSLHYQYLGKQQYSDIDYRIPPDTEYLLFDLNDFLYYQFLYREFDENNIKGAERIRELLAQDYGLTRYIGKFLLFEKNKKSEITNPSNKVSALPEKAKKLNINLANKIKMLGFEKETVKNERINNNPYRVLPITIYWQSMEKTKFDYQIKIELTDNKKIIFKDYYPLSAIYPTHDWQKGEIIAVYYKFLIPEYIKEGKYKLEVSTYLAQGRMGLNKTKVFKPFISNLEILNKTELLWINL